jgi:hypothetical protein
MVGAELCNDFIRNNLRSKGLLGKRSWENFATNSVSKILLNPKEEGHIEIIKEIMMTIRKQNTL